MSHIAIVKVEIRSLQALQAACERLGLELRLGQTSHRWFGQRTDSTRQEPLGRCAHAIGIPDDEQAYEIGVVPSPAGDGYALAYDFWGPQGRKLEALAGPDCAVLTQEYGAAVAELQAQELLAQGWQLARTRQPNGDIVLELSA